MNNHVFDPMAMDFALKQMKQIQKENEQSLRRLFDKKIKQNFLIEMLHKVLDTMGADVTKYYDLTINNDKMISGDMGGIEYEICRIITGIHRSNSIFLDDSKRTTNEKSEDYKKELTSQVMELIKLRYFAADLFRKKQIIRGDDFLFYPVPYKLFAICVDSLGILTEKGNNAPLSWFYSNIFNKSLASLTLIEDNFLDNAYPICCVVIELYFKLLLIEIHPEVFDEHFKFVDYDWKKTCCGHKYPDEFEDKFSNRKNQRERSRIDFLHYGWLDQITDYHEIVNKNPYSINGIIQYLEEKNDYNIDFSALKTLHKMCHSYTHGNVGISKYPLLHYFELNIILGSIIPHTFVMLLEHTKYKREINNMDVLKSFENDFAKLVSQYSERSTENFEAYYSYKK